jgi:hypothetical protein
MTACSVSPTRPQRSRSGEQVFVGDASSLAALRPQKILPLVASLGQFFNQPGDHPPQSAQWARFRATGEKLVDP